MQQCLNEMIFQILLVYFDDIIIFAQPFKEHLEMLDRVLTRLKEHGLKLKPSKSCFLRKKVTYVGHDSCRSGMESPNHPGAAFVSGDCQILTMLLQGICQDSWATPRAGELLSAQAQDKQVALLVIHRQMQHKVSNHF